MTRKKKKTTKKVKNLDQVEQSNVDQTKVEEKKDAQQNIRRITIDSVWGPKEYRLLVSRYKHNTLGDLSTHNWYPEYGVDYDIIKGKQVINWEEDDSFLKKTIKKLLIPENIIERRVYLVKGQKIEDITEFAREEAKILYKQVVSREK